MRFLTALRKAQNLSEREAAMRTGIARETLRSLERDPRGAKLAHLEDLARLLGRGVVLAIVPDDAAPSELSTVAISLAVIRDGFDSWKLHFMDLVDEFRRAGDVRLLMLPPVSTLDVKLRALMASIAYALCAEAGIEAPQWSQREYYLDRPWFVAGIESLKASAMIESPLSFRRNNIFVLANFMMRA
jgi:transcriptional regulator with XRE-family HTH domain